MQPSNNAALESRSQEPSDPIEESTASAGAPQPEAGPSESDASTAALASPPEGDAVPGTWEPGSPLPGLVALDAMQPSNNAALESSNPWRMQLPEEQWAYGILIPIHCPPPWPPERRALVTFDLEVESGRIGVAGIDISQTRLTTPEHHVSQGAERIELLIDPRTTEWIVLRTVSESGIAPRVILNGVSAQVAPET